MYSPAGVAISIWRDTVNAAGYPQIRPDQHFDVIVIGGGLAGLHSAYFLKQQGKKVAVIEADQIGHGVSGHTTAHITSEHNLIYDYLIENVGREKAQIYADANQYAISQITEIIAKEKINCDFERRSQYLFTDNKTGIEKLKAEFEATQKLGLPTNYHESVNLPFKTFGAIEYQNQAHFHPLKYMAALAKLIEGNGSQVFENSRVLDVIEGEPLSVKTELGNLSADDVIIATHFPILDRGGFFARMVPMRSYVIGAYVKEKLTAMYDDTNKPFHYIRTQDTQDGQLVLIGGEDHETGSITNTLARYQILEAYVRSHFTVKSIAYHWSSQDNYPHDRIPFIGHYTPQSKHLFVATGFYGYGMTQSLISGLLLTDLILGKANAWLELYTPQRINLKVEGLKLASTGVAMAKDKIESTLHQALPAKEVEKSILLKSDEGKVVEIDKDQIAIYRDAEGKIHAVSAACQHMGCTLQFNNGERSWDCPCHGSRYNVDGEILHAPTVKKLPQVKIEIK